MSSVALASTRARRLVEDEQRANGTDLRTAASAVARRLKRPSGTVWNLLFRTPKEISYDLFMALDAAVERRIESQIKDLENELAAIRAARHRARPGRLEEAQASLARLTLALRGEGGE